jgi:uncharacterized protein YlxW (UPF0749 family)
MLTQEDIQKLIEVFATRDEVALKKDYESLRQDFSDLQTSVDSYAKKANDYYQEMVMMNQKLNRHEKWIQQLAEKLEIKLEY